MSDDPACPKCGDEVAFSWLGTAAGDTASARCMRLEIANRVELHLPDGVEPCDWRGTVERGEFGAIVVQRPEPRYADIDPDWRKLAPKGCDFFCYRCQKRINPKRPYRMIAIDGGACGELCMQALHPDDAPETGMVEHYPVGMDCARAIGLDYTSEPST